MSTNVEQIKERLSIVDVISSYIKVEKAGINFKAKCPFHNEKTPSFMISPTRQSFYCFGCGEKGDIFTFVEKFENLDFKGALETLANRAGVELKNFSREEKGDKDEKDKLFEMMGIAAKFYEKGLSENKKILEYLGKRGINKTSVSKWQLGFAQDEWRSLHDYMIQKGFNRGDLLLVGLVKKVPDGEKYYDTFRNRIVFPIFDAAGRVIAFSGRAMKEDDKTPKYLNSPETRLFYKSEVLYGFNVAKNYIRKLDYAVLVEGQTDLIMSHQVGVLNTVASSGTALTELHLRKIQKLSNRVIIAYDSDEAGEKASGRAAILALSLGMETKIVSLPKGEDPASVIKENPNKWKEALRESEHFIDFALNKAVGENQGRNLAKEITKNVLPLVNLLSSEIEKSHFVKKIALKLKAREEAVWDDLKKLKGTEKIGSGENFSIEKRLKVINLERMMASIVFLEESMGKRTRHSKEKWQKVAGKKKVEEILDNLKEEKEVLIFEAERYSAEGDIKKISEDIIRRIELDDLKEKLQETAIALDDKDISKTDEKKYKMKLEKIQKRIKELSN